MTIKETRIILLLLVAASAAAQTTTVTGTITDPAGDLLSGSCSIQAVGPFSAATGWRVTGAPMVVPFSGGSFSAALAHGQHHAIRPILQSDMLRAEPDRQRANSRPVFVGTTLLARAHQYHRPGHWHG